MVPAAGADCASWISENMLSGAKVERRLAAILAADVAGCSRLMGEDDCQSALKFDPLSASNRDPSLALGQACPGSE